MRQTMVRQTRRDIRRALGPAADQALTSHAAGLNTLATATAELQRDTRQHTQSLADHGTALAAQASRLTALEALQQRPWWRRFLGL
jgi:hypothetical protein